MAPSCAQRAFEEVGGERDVMLWQTGEAQVFYEKLGARVVPTENILDSSSSSGAEGAEGGGAPRAFWDLVAMIYPVRHLRFCTPPILPCGCLWLAACAPQLRAEGCRCVGRARRRGTTRRR